MSVVSVKITVSDLASILKLFTHLKIYRATTLTGTYSEITVAATRPALETGVAQYTYLDTTGDPTYYYKSSYFNPTTALESELSDPKLGDDPALDIISVEELKTNYLFGIDLTKDDGTPYPDSIFETGIRSAVAWLEAELDIRISPYSVSEEKHDFYREDYDKYIWMQTKEFPILAVTEVTMVLPGEVEVMEFDSDWIHVQNESGHINIVPGADASSVIAMGAAGSWLPFIYGRNRFIPDVFRVTYSAGFAAGSVPANLKDFIGKKACFHPLNIAGDLLGGAGIASQSLGVDGLHQSFNTTSSATNAGYGARLLQYSKEIQRDLPNLRNYYKGIRAVVL